MSPWFYLGALAVLVAFGPHLVTSAVSFFDERTARKAERIVTESPEQSAARLADAEWAALARAIDVEQSIAAHTADFVDRLSPSEADPLFLEALMPSNVVRIPRQRGAVD